MKLIRFNCKMQFFCFPAGVSEKWYFLKWVFFPEADPSMESSSPALTLHTLTLFVLIQALALEQNTLRYSQRRTHATIHPGAAANSLHWQTPCTDRLPQRTADARSQRDFVTRNPHGSSKRGQEGVLVSLPRWMRCCPFTSSGLRKTNPEQNLYFVSLSYIQCLNTAASKQMSTAREAEILLIGSKHLARSPWWKSPRSCCAL